MNRRFAKLEEDGQLKYAPSSVKIGEMTYFNPLPARYLEAGWKRVVDVMPQEDGFWFRPLGWEEAEAEIRRTYEKVEIEQPEPQPMRYSKLKLITALKAAGKWAEVKQLIEDAGLWDEWLVCSYLKSDHELFEQAKAAVTNAGIATADEVEAILAQSVDEEI